GVQTCALPICEDAVAPAALAVEPIAGDAGLILHDRDPAPDEAVEQGRFAHVGPADQGDYGKLLHFKASLYSAFGLLYTTRGALASIAGVGPFPASVAHDDEIAVLDRKSTRLNSSHVKISYAVFCLKKKKETR